MKISRICMYRWFKTILVLSVHLAGWTEHHFSCAASSLDDTTLECIKYPALSVHNPYYCWLRRPICYFTIYVNITDRKEVFFPEKAQYVRAGCTGLNVLGFRAYTINGPELFIDFKCNTEKCNNISHFKDRIHEILRPYRLAILVGVSSNILCMRNE